MRFIWLGLLALVGLFAPPQAHAADAQLFCYQGPTNPQWAPCAAGNPLSVSASVTASITGFPTIQSTGTPISVTTGGVTGTLPTGTVVVATNVGATNAAYCKLGASATTSDQYIAPSGGWFQFTVGANTLLTCITSTSTTTVNMTGGSGLPTGTGGGGGGGSGGGGAVYGPTAGGSAAANPPVLMGGTVDGTTTGNVDNVKVASGLLWTQTSLNAETTKVIGTVNQGTSPWVSNISTWAGGTLGSMANFGTTPGAVLVPGTNASLFASVAGTQTALTATANGLKVDPSAVTQPVSGASAAFVDGWDASVQSTTASASCASSSGVNPCLKQIDADIKATGTTQLASSATGGCTGQVILSAANNNAAAIGTAAAHTLCWVRWENTGTSLYSIRFYDTATAPAAGAPCNSATGVVTNDVAQSNATSPGGVANLGPFGQAFANGIVLCITGANANNDNTNATTGLNLNIGYK